MSPTGCDTPKASTCLGHVGRGCRTEQRRRADPQVGGRGLPERLSHKRGRWWRLKVDTGAGCQRGFACEQRRRTFALCARRDGARRPHPWGLTLDISPMIRLLFHMMLNQCCVCAGFRCILFLFFYIYIFKREKKTDHTDKSVTKLQQNSPHPIM